MPKSRRARILGTPLFPVRLPLEVVVPVRMASAEERPYARRHVEEKEENTPAFVLAHVNALVPPTLCENAVADADDDMTESDRVELQRPREQRDRPPHPASADLHDAVGSSDRRAARTRHHREDEPDHRRRQRP